MLCFLLCVITMKLCVLRPGFLPHCSFLSKHPRVMKRWKNFRGLEIRKECHPQNRNFEESAKDIL